MPRISKYKLRNSDRSGFKFYEIELVKDGPWKVGGEEFDTPPPSRAPLGGEGDVAAGDQRSNSSFSGDIAVTAGTASGFGNPVLFVTTAAGITPSFVHPWMFITGSPGVVAVTGTPQIARGRQAQLLTLQCADSTVTLRHGSAFAINFMDSRATLDMTSGMIVTFVYDTGNAAWNEASRFRP